MIPINPYATILTLPYETGDSYTITYKIEIQTEDLDNNIYETENYAGKIQIPNDLYTEDGIIRSFIRLETDDKMRYFCFRRTIDNTVEVILQYERLVLNIDNYKQFYIVDSVQTKTTFSISKEDIRL